MLIETIDLFLYEKQIFKNLERSLATLSVWFGEGWKY